MPPGQSGRVRAAGRPILLMAKPGENPPTSVQQASLALALARPTEARPADGSDTAPASRLPEPPLEHTMRLLCGVHPVGPRPVGQGSTEAHHAPPVWSVSCFAIALPGERS